MNFSKGILFTAVLAASASFAKGVAIDTQHSQVKWLGKKVTGQHDGTIAIKSGEIELDGKNLKGGHVEIDMNSITCTDLTDAESNAKLIGHLKSEDFFSVEKHPTSTFTITSVKAAKGKDANAEITGDLSIKGQTHPVTFSAKVETDGKKAHVSGKVMVDRTKYDIRYGSKKFFGKIGDKAIHDEFEITIDVKN